MSATVHTQAFGTHFDYTLIPESGGWYTEGWETDAMARKRVLGVAQSLKALAKQGAKEVRGQLVVGWCVVLVV